MMRFFYELLWLFSFQILSFSHLNIFWHSTLVDSQLLWRTQKHQGLQNSCAFMCASSPREFSILISNFYFEYFESAGVKDSNYEYFQINLFKSIHMFEAHLLYQQPSGPEFSKANSVTSIANINSKFHWWVVTWGVLHMDFKSWISNFWVRRSRRFNQWFFKFEII